MSEEQWTAVDGFITGLVVPTDPALEAALGQEAETEELAAVGMRA